MCSRSFMKRDNGFMDFDTFKKIVDEISLYNSGIRFVRHGEPFLHPKILKMVNYAENKGVLTFISTNGSILSEKIANILESKLSVLRFSFQGIDKKSYELMRNNKRYDTVVQNIIKLVKERKRFQSRKPFVIVNTTVTNENSSDIKNFKEYWNKIVDKVEIGWTSFARLETTVNRIKHLIPTESLHRTYTPCTEVRTKLSINWNGDITPCCEDINGELVLGNIYSMSLLDAWQSNSLNNLRELVGKKLLLDKIPHCSNCYKTTNKFNELKKSKQG